MRTHISEKCKHWKRLIINFKHKNHGPTIDQSVCVCVAGYVEASKECILDLDSFKLSFLRGYDIPIFFQPSSCRYPARAIWGWAD